MQLSDIETRITALVVLGGWSNVNPAPNYAFLANEGLRLFSRESHHNIESVTITTVANQELYSLFTGSPVDTRDWIALYDDAVWNSGTPNSSIWIPQATRNQLRDSDRAWRMRPAGNPEYWYWAGPSTIGLWAIPSVSSIQISFTGARHEPVLVNSTDTPTLEADFHEGICLFGAWYWGKTYARGDEWQIVKSFYEDAIGYTMRYKESQEGREATLVQRRVERPPQEYMGTGAMQIPYRPYPQ